MEKEKSKTQNVLNVADIAVQTIVTIANKHGITVSEKSKKRLYELSEEEFGSGSSVTKSKKLAPISISNLEPKLKITKTKIELQISNLEQIENKFIQKDKVIFDKLVRAYTNHDVAHANILACELAEIRKMSKLTMNARLALDQVALRIKTVSELGDFVSALGPCIGVLRSVGNGLGNILPEAESELSDIGDMLSGLIFEAGSTSGVALDFENINESTEKILSKAAGIAEQNIGYKQASLQNKSGEFSK